MKINIDLLNKYIGDSKLSFKDLAIDSGVSYYSLRQLAKGKTRNPRPSTISAVCSSLGISPMDISDTARNIVNENTPLRYFKIYTAMINMGLSTADLANSMHVSENEIIDVLNGKAKTFDIPRLKLLCRTLKLNPYDVVNPNIPITIPRVSIGRGRDVQSEQ